MSAAETRPGPNMEGRPKESSYGVLADKIPDISWEDWEDASRRATADTGGR